MPQLWRPANDLGDIEPGIDFRLKHLFYSYILLLFPLPNTLREMNFNVIGRFDQVLKGDSLFFYWVIVVGLFFSIVIALWSLIDICWGIDAFCTVRRLALGVINSGISVVYFLMLWFLLHVIRLRLLNKVSLHNLLTFVQVELWQSIPI